jgi:large subunit ribosomal protein L4
MQAKQLDINAKPVGEIDINEAFFGGKVNAKLLSQYVLVHRRRKALGTKKTKGRGDVAGGGHKPWRQKHTGRARQGSSSSPLWVGGGHAHAISPTGSARIRLSHKMRVRTLVSALSDHMNNGDLVFVQSIPMDKPKTKKVIEILTNFELRDAKVLFVTASKDPVMEKSAANIKGVRTIEARLLNAHTLMDYDKVIFFGDSPKVIDEVFGNYVK